MAGRVSRIKGNRTADQLNRLEMISGLVRDYAEIVQRTGMRGVGLENLVINRLSLVKVSFPVVGQGDLKGLWHGDCLILAAGHFAAITSSSIFSCAGSDA